MCALLNHTASIDFADSSTVNEMSPAKAKCHVIVKRYLDDILTLPFRQILAIGWIIMAFANQGERHFYQKLDRLMVLLIYPQLYFLYQCIQLRFAHVFLNLKYNGKIYRYISISYREKDYKSRLKKIYYRLGV